jgi:hypothetical protein
MRSHPRGRYDGRGEIPFSHQYCLEPENSGQGLPETVLRVVIEKMSFPGFDGREGTEDQNPGGTVKNRRNRVCDGIHDKYPFRYILNDKIAIHVVL